MKIGSAKFAVEDIKKGSVTIGCQSGVKKTTLQSLLRRMDKAEQTGKNQNFKFRDEEFVVKANKAIHECYAGCSINGPARTRCGNVWSISRKQLEGVIKAMEAK